MNGMMGGGVRGMMGGMVHPAAMHPDMLAGEVEDEEDDVAAGVVQDGFCQNHLLLACRLSEMRQLNQLTSADPQLNQLT